MGGSQGTCALPTELNCCNTTTNLGMTHVARIFRSASRQSETLHCERAVSRSQTQVIQSCNSNHKANTHAHLEAVTDCQASQSPKVLGKHALNTASVTMVHPLCQATLWRGCSLAVASVVAWHSRHGPRSYRPAVFRRQKECRSNTRQNCK